MKARACLTLWIGAALILTGCWSKLELTERAFVLALAIDKGDKEKLEVTAQIYKPMSQFGPPSGQSRELSFVNVTLQGMSVSNIIRNTKTVSGRHSQFSHIQILLVSDEVARERLGDILDFFFRDPEVRLGTPVVIARGKARKYLIGGLMIESTLGSQVFKQMNVSAYLAGRSVNTNLRDLAFGLKSESEGAILPVITNERRYRQVVVQGIALARRDKLVGFIRPEKAPYLLLLAGKYKYGVLEIPCERVQTLTETVEVLHSAASMTPMIKGRSASARIEVAIDVSIGELACTTIRDTADEAKFAERIGQYFKEQMESVLDTLRKRKADVLGIGHKLYLRHPARWKNMKPDWPELYARMPIELDVKVHIRNSKMMNAGPFSRIGDN